MNEHETAKHFIDWLSVGTCIATLASWMPNIAALFSAIWFAIRIWESETVRAWRSK